MTDTMRRGAMLFSSTPSTPWVHTGRILTVDVRSPVDLTPWLPADLPVDDPFAASLTVVRAKRRRQDGQPVDLGFSQYQEAFIAVDTAGVDGVPAPHRLASWHDRPWPIQRRRIQDPRVRLATIEQTWRFPQPDGDDLDPAWVWHDVDLHRLGNPILRFRGVLDGTRPSDAGVRTGAGELHFSPSHDDEPTEKALFAALGEVEVVGCTLRDDTWTVAVPSAPVA